MNTKVILYTDGACSGNPGPGGWGCVLLYGPHRKELSGYEASTTNNRMELQSVLEGLSALKRPCEVSVYSDSSYVVNAFELGWIARWTANGWMTASKKPVENQDLWKQLLELMAYHEVRFLKVRGHSDDVLNNRCDELATGEIKRHRGE